MSRRGRKPSLEDTEKVVKQACDCVVHFKESSEHFTFIAKVKDPEVRWINLLKIRMTADHNCQLAGSPHRMESIHD